MPENAVNALSTSPDENNLLTKWEEFSKLTAKSEPANQNYRVSWKIVSLQGGG